MYKKHIGFTIIILLGSMGFFVSHCWAVTLLTEKEALEAVFHDGENIRTEICTIDDTQLAHVEDMLGGKFVENDHGPGAGGVFHRKDYMFYYATKDDKPAGIAIILEEPGKWGPIEYIVRLSADGKTIEDMAVMRYSETRGRPIARKSFLQQFIGKTANDSLVLGKDIVAVSGATFSSKATVFTAKKALAMYKVCYLKK